MDVIYQLTEYTQWENQLKKTLADLEKREKQLAASEQEVINRLFFMEWNQVSITTILWCHNNYKQNPSVALPRTSVSVCLSIWKASFYFLLSMFSFHFFFSFLYLLFHISL